ncbi:hypothetical protein CSC66_09100 [Pseudoxanthomonas kaohsiungensis]|nr:hypothetical protein CSC66_09100 [Pseudoxanthomonas kaohsiungensis]
MELITVPGDLDKIQAYHEKKRGAIKRLVHGIYVGAKHDMGKVLDVFAIRLASMLFPQAALTHSTAYYRKPIHGFVFIGGDYPYKRQIAEGVSTLTIVHSMSKPDVSDKTQYELVTLKDPMGEFQVYCATPEMILLQQQESTKKNADKHLGATELGKLFKAVVAKHGSKEKALAAIRKIAKKAGREAEADRLERAPVVEEFT